MKWASRTGYQTTKQNNRNQLFVTKKDPQGNDQLHTEQYRHLSVRKRQGKTKHHITETLIHVWKSKRNLITKESSTQSKCNYQAFLCKYWQLLFWSCEYRRITYFQNLPNNIVWLNSIINAECVYPLFIF